MKNKIETPSVAPTENAPGLGTWEGDDVVVHSYSRAEALADGVLVDASALAKEAGFRYPVALTAAAWHAAVSVDDDDKMHDETGRLWDVLNVLLMTIRVHARGGDTIHFCVQVADAEGRTRTVSLKSVCGPGDDLAPVVTIMLPEED